MNRITRTGYQNVIDGGDYKWQYNFELISEFNQLFVLIYLFHEFPNTKYAQKIDGTSMIVYARNVFKYLLCNELLFDLYNLHSSWLFFVTNLGFLILMTGHEIFGFIYKRLSKRHNLYIKQNLQ